MTTLSVLIVGGGASGTLLAIRLLRDARNVRVTLVEPSGAPGRGLAYATDDDRHVLNVVASKMSAFADDPDHFRRWLIQIGKVQPDEAFAFVPRRHFGDYLESTLRTLGARTGRLRVLRDAVVTLRSDREPTKVQLASGQTIKADIVVLATGHDTPYVPTLAPEAGGNLPALILGTGLSMVDTWLSLARSGGRIIAMSRRGLLPASHGDHPPRAAEAGNLPFGTGASQFMRWFRDFAGRTEAETGDWRSAVDALRPHTQRLWASSSIESRRRFLRHLKPWWDRHRHRLPAGVHRQLHEAIATGGLEIIAATPLHVDPASGAQVVRFRRRGSVNVETIRVGAVYDCRGLVRDWRDRPDSLVSRLVADGLARLDDLGLGIEVGDNNEVVAANGRVAPNLFAIGPLTRGKWFEIEAIPDIRVQCDRLAVHLEHVVSAQVSQRDMQSQNVSYAGATDLYRRSNTL